MLAYESLRESLSRLQMTAAENALDNVLESARTEKLSIVDAMDKLLRAEA
ncbi:MAG: hypothetical protein J7K88_11825 [Candidatus Fermentibacteraceae bacterium]|nr:hypothetical protein [Candidatus Fermentibacteraceae bacterium]